MRTQADRILLGCMGVCVFGITQTWKVAEGVTVGLMVVLVVMFIAWCIVGDEE